MTMQLDETQLDPTAERLAPVREVEEWDEEMERFALVVIWLMVGWAALIIVGLPILYRVLGWVR